MLSLDWNYALEPSGVASGHTTAGSVSLLSDSRVANSPAMRGRALDLLLHPRLSIDGNILVWAECRRH